MTRAHQTLLFSPSGPRVLRLRGAGWLAFSEPSGDGGNAVEVGSSDDRRCLVAAPLPLR